MRLTPSAYIGGVVCSSVYSISVAVNELFLDPGSPREHTDADSVKRARSTIHVCSRNVNKWKEMNLHVC